jgi:hypothetical protein
MPDSSITTMDITLQLVASFGQGAGVLLIEADALRPAYDEYAARIERSIPHWETDALGSISALRAMGAYAAHRALSERRVSITREDVAAALKVIQHVPPQAIARCRITGRGVDV